MTKAILDADEILKHATAVVHQKDKQRPSLSRRTKVSQMPLSQLPGIVGTLMAVADLCLR